MHALYPWQDAPFVQGWSGAVWRKRALNASWAQPCSWPQDTSCVHGQRGTVWCMHVLMHDRNTHQIKCQNRCPIMCNWFCVNMGLVFIHICWGHMYLCSLTNRSTSILILGMDIYINIGVGGTLLSHLPAQCSIEPFTGNRLPGTDKQIVTYPKRPFTLYIHMRCIIGLCVVSRFTYLYLYLYLYIYIYIPSYIRYT